MDYLPKDATIEQACNWLQAKTGQTWILPRLLECHLTPHFWLDYKSGYPAIYGDQIEGYQTHMMFQGDLCRLESDGSDALVNMFAAHDGSLIKTEPGLLVPLSELRFKRDRVERVAEIINNTAPAQNSATPAPLMTLEAQRGYVLILPYGQTHVQFGELAHLIADAIWPDDGADDSRTSYGLSRASLDGELIQAVKAGILQVKDPLTFGPHTFPVGNALLSALVAVDDLREFVATRGLTVETAQPQATTSSPAHVVTDQTKSLEPASDGPAKPAAPAWGLITSPERTPGYRWPLYQFLRKAHVAGEPCPKAQAVLDAWKLNPPSGLKVIRSGRCDALEYELAHGGKKTADLKAIQAAIKDLVIRIDQTASK